MIDVIARCPGCGTEQTDAFPACFVCLAPSRWWCRPCADWLPARFCPGCADGVSVPSELLLGTVPTGSVLDFRIPVRNSGKRPFDCPVTSPDPGVALAAKKLALSARGGGEVRGRVTVPPGAPGRRTFRVRFEADTPAETVLVVEAVEAVARLEFLPAGLALSAREPGGAVRSSLFVKNTGNVALLVGLACSEPWLSVEPRAVELVPGEALSLRVSATSKKTAFGTREAAISASAAGGTWEAAVRFALPNPKLAAEAVSFGELKPGCAAFCPLIIRNTGSVRAECALTAADPWVQVRPEKINLGPGKAKEVKVRALLTADHDGPQRSELIVTHATAGELLRVPVSAVGKVPKPRLRAVRKQTVRETGGVTVERKFAVANDGAARLDCAATADKPWLKILTPELKVAPGRKRRFRYTLDLAALPLGEHTANIALTSNGGSATVPVTVHMLESHPVLEVLPGPDLGLVSPDVTLSAAVRVRNAGVGLLTVRAMTEDGRVALSPLSADVSPGPPVRFSLRVPLADLPGGAHAVGVRFTSNGGEGRAELRFRLPVELFDVPALIDLGERPAARPVSDALRVRNTGPDPIALKVRGEEQRVFPAVERVALAPGETVSVPFRLELPADATGPVTGAIHVAGRSGVRTVCVRALARRVELVVLPGVVPLGDLTPGAEREFTFEVENRGELIAEIGAAHAPGDLEVRTAPARVRPGERVTVTGRARVNTRQVRQEVLAEVLVADGATLRCAARVVAPIARRVAAACAATGGLVLGGALAASVGWWVGVPLVLLGLATGAWLLWREGA